ncbi:hypothetical protein BSK64_13355 [Paenibacillus odorifer]|uniref:radical SAM/SPASM domain-containing protein n=1 Tax=Paenibacillus odorifer TaxID=189426 RepID=UPI00096D9A1E|nr:radical SAM protein [Paenibacillus odorifer]OME05861.1 hypothetical protein BSK64_13355 [Paenibacillus odorifer]
MNIAEIKIVKKNGKVILLNPENSHWVKMSQKIFDKYSDNWVYFSEYLDERFNLFKTNDRMDSIKSLYYSVTGKCNLNCSFCSMSSGTDISTEEDLTLDEIRYILIPKILEVNPKMIILTGGEPFVRRDVLDILKAFKNSFGKERILIQTNGLLLNEARINILTQYVGAVEISIENIFENEKTFIRMEQIFNALVENNCGLKFSFVINKRTAKYLPRAIDLTNRFNAACLLRFVSDVGRAASNSERMSYIEKIDIYINLLNFICENNYFSDSVTDIFFCSVQAKTECGGYGRTLGIHADGNIFMCSNLWDPDFEVGNIRRDSCNEIVSNLDQIKRNENIQNLFLVNKRKKCNECEIQYFCTGPCAAEIIEKEKKSEDIYSDCDLKKTLVNFMLYNFDNKKTKKENLSLLLEYLKEEKLIHATSRL